MKKLIWLLLALPFHVFGQLDVLSNNYDITPAHKWELGVHTGHFFSSGDIPFDPGYGVGLHVRRALDYIFSFRVDGQYGQLRGARFNGDDQFNTQWTSLSAHGIVSLNNLKWNDEYNRTNIYLYLGGGVNEFNTEYTPDQNPLSRRIDNARSTLLDVGLGFSIRLNENMNIGIDHKFTTLFSKYADQIDGFANQGFRDMTNYTSIRLNYNIGGKGKAEPLYWMNPLSSIIEEIQDIKKRQAVGPQDSDEDGVPDYRDLEPETPLGAVVDVRGITLDSDQDGIPNYKDQEPYSPPNYEYDENGVALQPDYITQDSLNSLLEDQTKLILSFLPNIHFRTNQSELRPREIEKLQYVGEVLRNYPDVRLLVVGFTDRQGSEDRNDELSYQRAKSVVDFLVDRYQINANQLVLDWKGESDELVVDEEESYMNRRVEFKVAAEGQQDREPPKGIRKKKGY